VTFRYNGLILTAFIAVLTISGRAATAAGCGESADRMAFATRSPVDLLRAESDPESEPVDVPFGKAYPLLDESPEMLRLCIDGDVRYSRPGQFVASMGDTLELDENIYLLQRPSIAFWRDRNGLESFLTQRGAADSAPDYTEKVLAQAARGYRFPVIERTSVAVSTVLRKDIEGVRVLVPFSRGAVQSYGDIQQRRERFPAPVFLLDGSGSAASFLNNLLAELGHGLASSERMSSEIRKVRFDGREPISLASSSLFDLINDGVATATRNPGNPQANSIGEALNDRLRKVAGPTGNAPLFALAGGDVDISGIDTALIGHVYAFQITPELDDELERSVAGLGDGNASFFPFAGDHSERLASFIDEMRNFAPSQDDGSNLYAEVAENQIQSGFMPILPTAPESVPDLLPAGSDDGKSDWTALELWLVVNRLMLKIDR
jgi:hypothetical protein